MSERVNKDGTTTFRVQYRLHGKMMQDSFGDAGKSYSRNSQEAKEYCDKLNSKKTDDERYEVRKVLYQRRNNLAGVPTLADFTASYLDPNSGLVTGIQPGTRHGYESIARNSFLVILGEYPLDAIQKSDVGKWVAWQEQQPSAARKGQLIAAKTVRNYHALLSNIFKAAIEQGYRPDNPARKTRISAGVAREPVFLSREEFSRLYDAVDPYYQPLVAFLVGSQTRWSEATALTWGDVNTDTTPPTVRINKAWKKNPGGTPVLDVPKSKKGRRTISLWPELVDMLGERGPGDQLVFRSKRARGKVWYSSFNRNIWGNAVRDSHLGRRPNIHDLRHTGASWLIADGQPLPFIQERLGHENITTTIGVYGHLLPDAHTRMSASLQFTMSNVLPIGVKEIGTSTDTPRTEQG
jgi:integrase